MRVCLVTTAFPSHAADPRGHFVRLHASAVQRQGVDVRVVTPHAPGARRREMLDGVEVIRVRYAWPESLEILAQEGGGLPAIWRKNRWARLMFGPYFAALVVGTLRNCRGCDLIHAHFTLAGMAAWIGQWLHRRPFVLMVHGSDIYIAPRLPVVGTLTRAMLPRAAHVIANSRHLAEATVALGARPERLEVMGNGIDSRTFRPGPEPREPLILFVGSLIARKAVDVLIQALPEVLAALPEHRLAVIGEGAEQPRLEALAESLGVRARVEFLGSLPQAQVSEWMRRAGVFVLPSREEAFGVVLLEAMASGTPVVASAVGGIPELVVPGVGRLAEPGDPASLAQAILAVRRDPAAWAAMSAQARAHVLANCNTWDRVGERTVALYRRLVGSHA